MPRRTLVIAEPGCTHEGRWEDMLRLLNVAHDAGADVFKPQYVSDPATMCERRHIGLDHPKRSYYEHAYGWNSYPIEWISRLFMLCKERGMQLACSTYLPEDVATVDPFVSIHKIASFESQDDQMIAAAEATGRRVVVSTGMSDDGWHHLWYGNDVLHCVSSYPAPLSAMNLSALDFDDRRNRCTGLSDHSRDVRVGGWAVMVGAEVIEAHIRLDDTSPNNPDFAAAFSPAEFAEYVTNIRDAEIVYGDGIKRIQECEQWALPYRVTS